MEYNPRTGKQQPHFSTILASRGKDNQPSDLEFALLRHCKRLIVKGKPLSGAHLLFAAERIAVRAYYPCDLHEFQSLEGEHQLLPQRTVEATNIRSQKKNEAPQESSSDNDNFDGLSAFLSSFQLAFVLFILPSRNNHETKHSTKECKNTITISQQLNDINSHFHRAQRLAVCLEQQQQQSESTNKYKTLRVIMLPDTESAVKILISIANSITPEKKEQKRMFFERLAANNYLPISSIVERNGDNDNAGCSDNADITIEVAAARHAARGLRTLAEVFDWPIGEADQLMSEMGTLRAIATACDRDLEGMIPIDRRTRKVLNSFFGTSSPSTFPFQAIASNGVSKEGIRREDLQQQPAKIVFTPAHRSSVATELFPRCSTAATAFEMSPQSSSLHSPTWSGSKADRKSKDQIFQNRIEDQFWQENTGGGSLVFEPNCTNGRQEIKMPRQIKVVQPSIQAGYDTIPKLDGVSSSLLRSPWEGLPESDLAGNRGPRSYLHLPFIRSQRLPGNQSHQTQLDCNHDPYYVPKYMGDDSLSSEGLFVSHQQYLPTATTRHDSYRNDHLQLPPQHFRPLHQRRRQQQTPIPWQQNRNNQSRFSLHSLNNYKGTANDPKRMSSTNTHGSPSFSSYGQSNPNLRQQQLPKKQIRRRSYFASSSHSQSSH